MNTFENIDSKETISPFVKKAKRKTSKDVLASGDLVQYNDHFFNELQRSKTPKTLRKMKICSINEFTKIATLVSEGGSTKSRFTVHIDFLKHSK